MACLHSFGDKVIGPGGDYADLATWEAAVDGQTNFTGWSASVETNDAGIVTFDGFAAAPVEGDNLRIYAGSGWAHGGSNEHTASQAGLFVTAAGASINGLLVYEPWLTFKDLIITIEAGTSNFHTGAWANYDSSPGVDGRYSVFDSCLFRVVPSTNPLTALSALGCYYEDRGDVPETQTFATVKNCIFYGDTGVVQSASTFGLMGRVRNYGGASNGTVKFEFYNNSIYNWKADAGSIYFKHNDDGAGNVTNLSYVTNNVVIGNVAGSCYSNASGGTAYINNFGYNASSDTSSDDHGGSGAVTGITAAATWSGPGTNMFPVLSGPIYRAGIAVSVVTNDAIDQARTDPPDIGALQNTNEVAATYRRRIILNAIY